MPPPEPSIDAFRYRTSPYELIVREAGKLRDQVENAYVDVVFDGPPGAGLPRFVEVENEQAKSIDFGKWMERSDGWWVLRILVAGSVLRRSNATNATYYFCGPNHRDL